MTPAETALRFMRQRGTTTGHPEFVAAYLVAERSRDRRAFDDVAPPTLAEEMERLGASLRRLVYVAAETAPFVAELRKALQR